MAGRLVDMAAVKIGEQYKLGRAKLGGSIKHLLKCGEMLIGKKAEFKHGEWGKWQEGNASVLGFRKVTAQRLMKAAGKYVASEEFGEEKALEISRELWGHEEPKKKSGSKARTKKEPPNYSKAVAEVLGDFWILDHEASDVLEIDWQASTWLCNPPAGSVGLLWREVVGVLGVLRFSERTSE
jgi:hypothetical protein